MKKIVMVEDNEDHAFLIKKALEKTGGEVVHYQDGLAAVAAFEKISTVSDAPHLVLLDLQLPGHSGFEILERLNKKSWFAFVPVVILTTSSRKEEVARAYRLGAKGYVVKSEGFEELCQKIGCVADYWLETVEPADGELMKKGDA